MSVLKEHLEFVKFSFETFVILNLQSSADSQWNRDLDQRLGLLSFHDSFVTTLLCETWSDDHINTRLLQFRLNV